MIGQLAVILTLLAVPAYLTALAAVVLLTVRGARRCAVLAAALPAGGRRAVTGLDRLRSDCRRCAEVLAELLELPS